MPHYTAEDFEKRSMAVYLACEDSPAADLSACLRQAAKRERDWQQLRARIKGVKKLAIWKDELLAEMARLDAATQEGE